MTTRTGLLLLGGASLLACSTLVGADFDDRNEGAKASGGSVATSGGTNALGGQTSGGAPSGSGGSQPNSGGSSSGGSSSGGSSSGGTTLLGSGGTTGGSAGQTSTGGRSGGATASGGSATAGRGGTGPAGSGGQGEGGVGGQPQGGDGGEPEVGGAGGEAGSGGAPAGRPVVVLNEVKGQGSGDDFVEIYNRGPGTLDLSGYLLVDQGNNDFVFPNGTSIVQGDHVLLLLGQTSPGSGPFTCFVPNHPCFHANWGISQNGETVYFRDPQGLLLDSTAYPSQSGASALTNEQTWGRIPDGSGPFRATRVTPEAENLPSP